MRLCERLEADRDLHTPQNISSLLSEREHVNSKLQSEPMIFDHHLHRAAIHYNLDYPDLAAADVYKALSLLESHLDPENSDFHPEMQNGNEQSLPGPGDGQAITDVRRDIAECYKCLVLALVDLGCLSDAFVYLRQLNELDTERIFFPAEDHEALRHLLLRAQAKLSTHEEKNVEAASAEIKSSRLPDLGIARREIYPWNKHEADRSSPHTINTLNDMLKPMAADLEVRSVQLPVLECSDKTSQPSVRVQAACLTRESASCQNNISHQLGLFAKTDLSPSPTPILCEPSVLTAVRHLNASVCHNCGEAILQESVFSSEEVSGPTYCPSCADAALFCSRSCLDNAQSKFHGTTCGVEDIESLGRDENSEHPSEDLYFLLLLRAFAMSQTQNIHPLELPETKYLWGEFEPPWRIKHGGPRSLPFTFQHNIVLPFRLLSTLSEQYPDMSPFSPRGTDWYDTWVVQTLYAKFRGVASARQSTWDGKPEVAAVHPLWSLANHSCAPNVKWDWGREQILQVRQDAVRWADQDNTRNGEWNGIRAGEEILSHYCDIDLPVQKRREYMLGSLGGVCMCERCVWEAAHTLESGKK